MTEPGGGQSLKHRQYGHDDRSKKTTSLPWMAAPRSFFSFSETEEEPPIAAAAVPVRQVEKTPDSKLGSP